jgi:hypothetical protein
MADNKFNTSLEDKPRTNVKSLARVIALMLEHVTGAGMPWFVHLAPNKTHGVP